MSGTVECDVKMYAYLILLIFVLKNIEVLSSARNLVRCTRRYTAGYCEEEVKPVWTVRMGCPPSSRVNRFRKYRQCMQRCKVLVDLYTQILLNATAARAHFQGSPRRNIDGRSYLQTELADPEHPELYDNARDVPQYDGVDDNSFEGFVPVNIDGDTQIHTFLDVLNDNK